MLTVYALDESLKENKEYEYEIIDKDTGLIVKKKLYSFDSNFSYEMPGKDFLLKVKIRNNGKECYKKNNSII